MFVRVLNMFLQRNDLISLMLDIYIGSNLNALTIRKHRQKDPYNFDFCYDCGYHPNQHVDDKKMKCRMPF